MPEDQFTRRSFLQTAAAARAAAGAAPSSSATPRRLSENLFAFDDTCQVYLIHDGSHGLLIDFGSGAILPHLSALGITSIDWVLHTHHHRDQAQGDALAVERRIPIAVPAFEKHLFENAENFWRNRQLYDLYNVRNDFLSLTRNVPVARVLTDYETFEWRGHKLLVQPTPGHTPGSISLITEVDGVRVAFTGDLIHSAGHVVDLYDFQYEYAEHEGVDQAEFSLRDVARHKPALLCPSHGTEIREPLSAIEQTRTNLREWFRYWRPGGSPITSDIEGEAVTKHLIAHPTTLSNFYALIADSGKALFIDYGLASYNFFQVARRTLPPEGGFRFVEHSIERLREKHGLRSIDVAIPTHMHDDHVCGLPYLRRRYGTRVWAHESFAEVIAKPGLRNVGCVNAEPVPVDRVLKNAEKFTWEGFEFQVVHSPGHTQYQSAILATIDGKRIAFTGDALFDYARNGRPSHNLIFRNQVKTGDHLRSLRAILEFAPDLIAPGHGPVFALTAENARGFEERLKQQDAIMQRLIAGNADVGLDPSWVRVEPYVSSVTAGSPLRVEVCVRNHWSDVLNISARFDLPRGWRSEPASVELSVPPGREERAKINLLHPGRASNSRIALPLDVTAGGKRLGQLAEAVFDMPQNGEKSKA